MAMPNELVLVRHGNSEANIIQTHQKEDPDAVAPEGFFDRHDSLMRLSPLGRAQAEVAGEWLAIPPRKRYSDADLLRIVDMYPPLLGTPDELPATGDEPRMLAARQQLLEAARNRGPETTLTD